MKKVLLIYPPSGLKAYSASKVKAAMPHIPPLGLAVLAAQLIKNKCDVEILDLSCSQKPIVDLGIKLKRFSPKYVGITFTTPLFYEIAHLTRLIRKLSPKVTLIAGGVHATSFPENVLKKTEFDIVIRGEADITIVEVILGKDLGKVKGVSYKKNKKIFHNLPRPLIENLDDLPFPAWELFDIRQYKSSKLTSRKNPVGALEPSRGCFGNCSYCNKNIFGNKIRYKSPERIVDEMEYLLSLGFKEIHIWDDNFASDLDRAKKICNLIIKRKLKFPWNLINGVRVNCVDEEFFQKIAKAGCYQTGFGFESGNQQLLNNIRKGITLKQSKNAAKWAKKAGLETVGYFMLGLPGETEETMQQTMDFAKELDLDYAKCTILLPFPSTDIYNKMEKEGKIKSKDWSKYNFHDTSEVYIHENLDWDTLHKYYNLFYKKFYFRPSYILKRIKKGIFSGYIFYDIYYSLKTWL